jgi:hypothetical protein
LRERLTLAEQTQQYVGKYYSNDYVRRHVLRQTDEEIIEQDKLIEKEIESGAIPDPAMAALDPMAGGAPVPGGALPPSGGGAPLDPPTPEAPETPTGGEI